METWSLDAAFYQWLYEGLRCFLEQAEGKIDLEYDMNLIEYCDKKYTMKSFIELLLLKLERILQLDTLDSEEENMSEEGEIPKHFDIEFENVSFGTQEIHP